jgi:hypothetical protein
MGKWYSRVRTSAFFGRRGVTTVRFSVVGATSFRWDFATIIRLPGKSTVRITREKRTAGKAGAYPGWVGRLSPAVGVLDPSLTRSKMSKRPAARRCSKALTLV